MHTRDTMKLAQYVQVKFGPGDGESLYLSQAGMMSLVKHIGEGVTYTDSGEGSTIRYQHLLGQDHPWFLRVKASVDEWDVIQVGNRMVAIFRPDSYAMDIGENGTKTPAEIRAALSPLMPEVIRRQVEALRADVELIQRIQDAAEPPTGRQIGQLFAVNRRYELGIDNMRERLDDIPGLCGTLLGHLDEINPRRFLEEIAALPARYEADPAAARAILERYRRAPYRVRVPDWFGHVPVGPNDVRGVTVYCKHLEGLLMRHSEFDAEHEVVHRTLLAYLSPEHQRMLDELDAAFMASQGEEGEEEEFVDPAAASGGGARRGGSGSALVFASPEVASPPVTVGRRAPQGMTQVKGVPGLVDIEDLQGVFLSYPEFRQAMASSQDAAGLLGAEFVHETVQAMRDILRGHYFDRFDRLYFVPMLTAAWFIAECCNQRCPEQMLWGLMLLDMLQAGAIRDGDGLIYTLYQSLWYYAVAYGEEKPEGQEEAAREARRRMGAIGGWHPAAYSGSYSEVFQYRLAGETGPLPWAYQRGCDLMANWLTQDSTLAGLPAGVSCSVLYELPEGTHAVDDIATLPEAHPGRSYVEQRMRARWSGADYQLAVADPQLARERDFRAEHGPAVVTPE